MLQHKEAVSNGQHAASRDDWFSPVEVVTSSQEGWGCYSWERRAAHSEGEVPVPGPSPCAAPVGAPGIPKIKTLTPFQWTMHQPVHQTVLWPAEILYLYEDTTIAKAPWTKGREEENRRFPKH